MNALPPRLLLAAQSLSADSVVTIPVRDAFDYIQAATLILVIVGILTVLALLVILIRAVRKLRRSMDPLVHRVDEGIQPVLERARSVSENVDYVSHAVRNDVENLAEAVDRIRRRLDQASDRMEERIEEFNALMEVVQSEAEDIFIDTASAVRGVREGSRSLAEPRSGDGGAPPGSRRSTASSRGGPAPRSTDRGVGERRPPERAPVEEGRPPDG